jgi:hypothetical protein
MSMNNGKIQLGNDSLKELSTMELDQLMSNLLTEMRRRDSRHFQSDVGESVQALRKLRGSGKLRT